jgi:hypothetical protein
MQCNQEELTEIASWLSSTVGFPMTHFLPKWDTRIGSKNATRERLSLGSVSYISIEMTIEIRQEGPPNSHESGLAGRITQ